MDGNNGLNCVHGDEISSVERMKMCVYCVMDEAVFFSLNVCVWSEENCGLVRDRRGTEVPFISTRGDGLGQSRSVATVERERERERHM